MKPAGVLIKRAGRSIFVRRVCAVLEFCRKRPADFVYTSHWYSPVISGIVTIQKMTVMMLMTLV